MELESKNDGISSDSDGRSMEANIWWMMAKDRGLAREAEGRAPVYERVVRSCRSGDDCAAAKQILGSKFDIIESYQISATAGKIKESSFDVFESNSAVERGLFVYVPNLKSGFLNYYEYSPRTCFAELSQTAVDNLAKNREMLPLETILALNTGIFGKNHWRIVQNIVRLAILAGATLKQVQQLTDRYEAGIDIEADTANAEGLLSRAREKPANKLKSNPTKKSRWNTVHYAHARNPPDLTLQKSLKELSERRTNLGWDKLSDLP